MATRIMITVQNHPAYSSSARHRARELFLSRLAQTRPDSRVPANTSALAAEWMSRGMAQRGGLSNFMARVARHHPGIPFSQQLQIWGAFSVVLNSLHIERVPAPRREAVPPPRPFPEAKRQPVEASAKVPKDPIKLLEALRELKAQIQLDPQNTMLAASLGAHLAVAKMLLSKPGVPEETLAELRAELGRGEEGAEAEGKNGAAKPNGKAPAAEATAEATPEGGETPKPETEPQPSTGIMGWLWPTAEPWYKRPATWIAGVIGAAALYAGTRSPSNEKE